jgi:hypothetical protein
LRERRGADAYAEPSDADAYNGEIEDVILTHYAVKGPWRAWEVEPCLAPMRSSLNPAFMTISGYGDDDER